MEVRDLVIVPVYYRPEFLALCLDHILKAEGGREKEVWVLQDRHTSDAFPLTSRLGDVRRAAEWYSEAFAAFRFEIRKPHQFRGNPYNFLEAYREAYLCSNIRYVYLIEEDVFVSRDFFRWHEAIQERVSPWVSVGWHCIRNPEVVPTRDARAYVTSYRDFSSIGLCWRRENLAPVAIHARPSYYSSMAEYLGKVFPRSPIAKSLWTEQAGLITRLLHETRDRLVAWAGLTRVAHVGISGYHRARGFQFRGSLEERVEALRKAALSTESLLALSQEKFDDINALPDIPEWRAQDLFCAQHIPYIEGKI